MTMPYIKQGQRLYTPEGVYLATAAQDITRGGQPWSASMFTDTDLDLDNWAQRLPLTAALLLLAKKCDTQ